MTISTDQLRTFSLFEGYLDDDLEAHVLPHLRVVSVAPGDTICEERAPGDRCFFLVEGEVDVQMATPAGKRESVGRLGTGSLFGQIAMLDGGTRSASCVARSACTLLVLARDDFDALRASGNPFAFDLLREIARSLARQVRQATENLSVMSESRVEDPNAVSERLKNYLRAPGRSDALSSSLRIRKVEL